MAHVPGGQGAPAPPQGSPAGEEAAREAAAAHDETAESFERELPPAAQPHEIRGDSDPSDPHGSDPTGQ